LALYFFWGIKNSSLEQLYCHVNGNCPTVDQQYSNQMELKHRPETLNINSNPFLESTTINISTMNSGMNPFDPNYSPDDNSSPSE